MQLHASLPQYIYIYTHACMCTYSHHEHDTITPAGSRTVKRCDLRWSAKACKQAALSRPRLEAEGFLSAQRVVADVTRARRRIRDEAYRSNTISVSE